MIDGLIEGCLEAVGHWIFGAIFFIASIVVFWRLPASDSPLITGYLGVLLLHASAMLIVGFGFDKMKRFLTLSWFVSLVVFFVGVTVLMAL